MDVVHWTRVAPAVPTTTDRLMASCAASSPGVRRAAAAAVATSAVLAAAAPGSVPQRAALGAVGVLLALAALVDAHERRLPNRLLMGATVAVATGWVGGPSAGSALAAAAGAVLAALPMVLVRRSRGVGLGDVKMAAVVGLSLGGSAVLAAPAAIAVGAAAAGSFGLAARRTSLPLGPSLWAGWAAALAMVIAGVLP